MVIYSLIHLKVIKMNHFKKYSKPIILIITILFLLYFTVNAQTKIKDKFVRSYELGGKFLPTITDFQMYLSKYQKISSEFMLGYGGGIFFGYNLFPHFGIQVELNYISISKKYSIFPLSRIINLEYISLPILISLHSSKSKLVSFNCVLGTQLGINTSSIIFSSGFDPLQTENPILKLNKIELGLVYGIGIDFGLNKQKTLRIGFGFRCANGLFNMINQNNILENNKFYIIKNTTISTYTGYIGFSFRI